MVVGVWGETVGFITFGFVLGLIGLTGVAYMKAKEDLRSAEREEERIMNRMRQGDVGFPGIHNP
jgi:hypothetical protein